MEVEFIRLNIAKLLVKRFKVAQSSIQLLFLQEWICSFNYVPMILKFIRVGFISHKESHHIFCCAWFLAFEQVIHTNVVHVSVSQVGLSCFIYCIQSLNVSMQTVFDLCFDNVKFWHCICMSDCLFNEIMSLFQGLELHAIMLCQYVQWPQILRRWKSLFAIWILTLGF